MTKLAEQEPNAFKRLLYLTTGWVSLILGIIGIILPLLPTTPFILLSAWCFSQSSKRFHNWLTHHKYFGPMIEDWQSDKGIPKKSRNRAIIFMWCGMGLSIFIVSKLWATLMLVCIGTCVSIYLLRLPLRTE
jgi:uncharacterized membrane protein YbaN (DUF454 family)